MAERLTGGQSRQVRACARDDIFFDRMRGVHAVKWMADVWPAQPAARDTERTRSVERE
jgi:hypothetical protein